MNSQNEEKQKSTAQLWSRRETLKKRKADIDAEIAKIDAKLRAELEANN